MFRFQTIFRKLILKNQFSEDKVLFQIILKNLIQPKLLNRCVFKL
jgi:hypothetical protein